MIRRERIRFSVFQSLLTVLSVLALAGGGSAAEKFPSREIVIVNAYAAGSSTDLAARVLAEYLQKELGVPIIVEDRPEANGVKAVVDVYKAKPDGYLLLNNLIPRNCQMEIVYKTPYKILELTYLPAFQRQDMLLAVNKDSPYKTLKDLVEASKKKPMNCSIGGMGSRSHLVAMLLKKKVGINFEVVPYKGNAQAVTALLGGHVDLTTADDLAVLSQKEKLRLMAIFYDERTPKFPGVPTLKELGYDFPIVYTTEGISGPPGLPDGIAKILSDGLTKAIKNPAFIAKIDQMGPSPVYFSGPEFRKITEASYKVVEEYKDIFLEEKKK